MKIFFESTDSGAGVLQREQAYDIAQYNVWWVENRESNLKQNFFISERNTGQI
jgi:hypothetical protein